MTTDYDIAVVADILNANLGPDGWDIGALEHIAEYAVSRGQIIWDHDDPSMEWNQANYEGKVDPDMKYSDEMIQAFESLGVEPPLKTEAQVTEGTRKRDQVLEQMDTALDHGYYDYTIEFRVENAEHEGFKYALAALVAGTRCLEYDIKVTPKFNPIRFDNQPF